MQSNAPPSFIPEGYTSIAAAIALTDDGWPALRQHLWSGRVHGFILTDEGPLVRVPKTDWASPKNDDVDATGVVNKITRLRLGDRVWNGFAVVATDDLETIKPRLAQTSAAAEHSAHKRTRGRRAWARESAKRALDALYPDGVPDTPWKIITAEVNDWLVENQGHSISDDTVRRAAKELK